MIDYLLDLVIRANWWLLKVLAPRPKLTPKAKQMMLTALGEEGVVEIETVGMFADDDERARYLDALAQVINELDRVGKERLSQELSLVWFKVAA